MVKLSTVKKDEFLRMKVGAKKTYIRGDYVRELQKYSILNWEGADERLVKGSTLVYVGFTY